MQDINPHNKWIETIIDKEWLLFTPYYFKFRIYFHKSKYYCELGNTICHYTSDLDQLGFRDIRDARSKCREVLVEMVEGLEASLSYITRDNK